MIMSDEELDHDWKPNGRRPQSTIAKSFSQELMDIFRIENSVTDLDMQVDKRKQEVQSKSSELQALEVRLREMEARLQAGGKGDFPPPKRPSARPSQQHSPIEGSFLRDEARPPAAPVAKDGKENLREHAHHKPSRPGTACQSQQAMPGALPPTPGPSEGDY